MNNPRKPFKDDLPSVWRYEKAGNVFKESKEKNKPDMNLLSVTMDKGVIPQGQSEKRNISSANKDNYKVIKPNDIVYNTMRMWQGVSAVSIYTGIVSPAYTVLKPTNQIIPHFAGYLFKNKQMINAFRRYSQGLVNDTLNLKYKEFKDILIPLPPLKEQQKIAAILSSVDEAIEKTEAIIEQTATVKKGVMQELLTKGIGHTEYKNTLIGRIPRNWNIVLFSDYIMVNPRYKLPHQEQLPFVEMAAVPENDKNISYFNYRNIGQSGLSKFKNGDTLFARITPCTENGKTAYVQGMETEYGIGSTEFIVLSPHPERVYTEFVYYLVISGRVRNYAISQMAGSTGRQRVPISVFTEQLVIALPPIEEQEKITKALSTFEQKIQNEKEKLNDLDQIKQGLMQQLLTGKVRVPVGDSEEVLP